MPISVCVLWIGGEQARERWINKICKRKKLIHWNNYLIISNRILLNVNRNHCYCVYIRFRRCFMPFAVISVRGERTKLQTHTQTHTDHIKGKATAFLHCAYQFSTKLCSVLFYFPLYGIDFLELNCIQFNELCHVIFSIQNADQTIDKISINSCRWS